MLRQLKNRAASAISFARRYGAGRLGQELFYRLVNGYYDRRLGIRTTSSVRLSDLGIVSAESIDSSPLGYPAFFSILKRVPLDRSTSVFLDYGAGKGRVVCAASTSPFRRVIGVEFSDVLLDLARQNVERMKHRRAKDVELVHSDATAFEVPSDVNLIYFYNPFFGETLRRVVDNIRLSHRRHPRKIYVIFFNNNHFDEIIGQGWLTKTHQSQFYPRISCGVYETYDRALVSSKTVLS